MWLLSIRQLWRTLEAAPVKMSRCLIVAPLLIPFAARAQLTGAIRGMVTDPSGRGVPAAQMRVVETNTNAERRLATSHEGGDRAGPLAPGRDRLGGDPGGGW